MHSNSSVTFQKHDTISKGVVRFILQVNQVKPRILDRTVLMSAALCHIITMLTQQSISNTAMVLNIEHKQYGRAKSNLA